MLTTVTIICAILKIAGVINISWFFVFLPLVIELVAIAIGLIPAIIKTQSDQSIQALIKRNEQHPKR